MTERRAPVGKPRPGHALLSATSRGPVAGQVEGGRRRVLSRVEEHVPLAEPPLTANIVAQGTAAATNNLDESLLSLFQKIGP